VSIYSYKEFSPKFGKDCFVAESADIIGRVSLGDHANIWFGTVIRGDVNEIVIGENTNVQDLCMLHVTAEGPLHIGKNISIGHSVTLHACRIGDGCLLGMGSIILDGAVIGKNSLVAAGTVVPPGKEFPEGVLLMGSPAKIVRYLRPEEIERFSNHYKSYITYKAEFRDPQLFRKLDIKF
jgi:carbonic anhydrase/acetyltransferase-like protein (isoleucine patch superfamily)